MYRIDRSGDRVSLVADDGSNFSATGSNGNMSVMIRSYMPASDLIVDWVRVRPSSTLETTLAFGDEETVP